MTITNNVFHTWLEMPLLALLAAIVGSVVAYAALGFLVTISWLHAWLVGASGDELYLYLQEIHWVYLFIIPTVGALLVNLMVRYGAPEYRNYGPADVIYAAKLSNGEMPLRAGLVNAAASVVSIGSGASVGRYGPVVHLGATLGVWLAKQLKLDQSRRKMLLACGVAAAISASFSAPLAAVVFAYEVIVGRFSIKYIMPIVVASVIATVIAKFHGANMTLFMLPDIFVETNWEYLLFALVGVIGGGLAVCFMALMQKTNQIAQQLPGSFVTRALLGGVLLGGIIIIFPQTFGLGEQVIQSALKLEITIVVLLLLVLAKLLATTISFAAGFAGGVFGPALYMGTMLGTAIGLGAGELLEISSSPIVYGVAGMGAVISRVVGSPIATILMVFELTGSYSLTTAVMVSVVVSNTVTRKLFNYSYFYQQLRGRGINPEESRAHKLLRETPISSLVDNAPVVITNDTSVATVYDRLIKQAANEAYVVDHEGRLLGQIDAARLLKINNTQLCAKPVSDLMFQPAVILSAQMNVLDASAKLHDFVGFSIPVVDNEISGYFSGVIYQNKVMRTYLKITKQSEQEML